MEGVHPGTGFYTMAKKSLRDITLAAALEWAPRIRVNAVAPGFSLAPPDIPADRRQAQLNTIPLGREIDPNDIAGAVLYLLQAQSVTGQILYVDGGLHLT